MPRIFYTDRGRLRLGWRLATFALLTLAVAVLVGALVPPELPWVGLPFLAGALVAGGLLLRREGYPLESLGLPLGRESPRILVLGTLVGTAVALAAVALITVTGGLTWSRDTGSWTSWVGAAATALWAFALPAAGEEVLLRGYPLQALGEAWGAARALAATSLAFGLLHLGNPGVGWLGVTNVAAAGLFLGALYLRTGSLWWPTGAHLGWNWAHAFLSDLPVSGFDALDAPLVDARPRGPDWLSGGSFGPEGSVLATVVVLAAAAWAWHTRLLGPTESARRWPPLTPLHPEGAGERHPPAPGGS